MKRIILTSENYLYAVDPNVAAYYIIKDVIYIKGKLEFHAGSVLDFRGGAFEVAPLTLIINNLKISLNGSTVSASAYCIFGDNIDVVGFGNSYIKSEWFKAENMPEHAAINRSLKAAQGIPVHLEGRTYNLTEPIVFPTGPFSKTLVSPGTLQISDKESDKEDKENAAILVDSDYINLDINKIQYVGSRTDSERTDTGILLTGNAYNIDIKVNIIKDLSRAIAVIPDLKNAKVPWSGVQYCTIRFKDIINAEYCFYVDIFFNGKSPKPGEKPEEEEPEGKWFSETRVIGGRMSGVNGIYFVDPGDGYSKYAEKINGLLFENIQFENLTGEPIFLSHISSSKFLYLRFASGMPATDDQSNPWIHLNYVSYLTLSLKGRLDPMRVRTDENVKSVIIDTCVIDDFGWYINHFDRLAIMPLYDNTTGAYKPKMVATSSIQPYNMTKTISAYETPATGVARKQLTINDLLPLNCTCSDGKISRFNVLPRTLNLFIKADNIVEIDLSGLSRFAPCVMEIYGMIERGGSLVFKTSQFPSNFKVLDRGEERTESTVTFTDFAIYRLNFDSDWNVVISQVLL